MRTAAAFLLIGLSALARETRVTVVATTDLHGNIYPYDYLTGKPAPRGLASIATLIQAERKANPNVILIDTGDTIQGAPLESVWQQYVRTGKLPAGLHFPSPVPTVDPMMLLMNRLGYAAMAVGNHEFNYGLSNLEKARFQANFPWLAANTKATGGRKPFGKYVVKQAGGVKVAIIGLMTPAVPSWEKPENYHDYSFTDVKTAALEAVSELREKEKPDIIVAGIHAGLERDLKTGAIRPGETPKENMVYQVATEVPGIDAIAFGHTHQSLENQMLNGVLLVQAKNWGMSLGAMDFVLEDKPEGGWKIRSKSSRLIPVREDTVADPDC